VWTTLEIAETDLDTHAHGFGAEPIAETAEHMPAEIGLAGLGSVNSIGGIDPRLLHY
jgi:hypothetical protein